MVIGYIFPVLVCCTEKNLATLISAEAGRARGGPRGRRGRQESWRGRKEDEEASSDPAAGGLVAKSGGSFFRVFLGGGMGVEHDQGDRYYDFLNFFSNFFGEKIGVSDSNQRSNMQKFNHNIGFKKTRIFSPKIVENRRKL
jgi:hypothetical protein